MQSKNKIEQAIKELDYTPNELSRNLFFKRSGIVAVLVPYISHPFYAEFCHRVEDELYLEGYKTMVCNTAGDHKSEAEYLEMLNRHIVDGIITAVHTLDVEAYIATEKPIVAMDRYLSDNIPIVSVDHYKGGEIAAKHMIECGCTKALQFQGALSVPSPAHERHIAFSQVMRENGITVYTKELSHNKFDDNYFKEVVREVFDQYPYIDGVFGADMLSIQFMIEAMRHGKKVPDDINIIAYDGTYITDLTYPKMTAIVQPIDKLAYECVRLLIARINNMECEEQVRIDVGFVQGDSTRIK